MDVAQIPIQRKERSNIWPLLLGLLAVLAVLWYVFARKHTDDTAQRPADSTTTVASNGAVGTTDSAGGAAGNNATGAMAGGAAAGAAGAGMAGAGSAGTSGANNGNSSSPASAKQMTDAEIFSMVQSVNAGEETAGRLAESKASSADVKAFARDMVRDHSTMNKQGASLASALGVAAKPAAKDSIASANDSLAAQLRTKSGKDFDQAYINAQVEGHSHVLSFLQQAQSQAQNADLKTMVTKAIPDVQKHLDRARALQSKVGT